MAIKCAWCNRSIEKSSDGKTHYWYKDVILNGKKYQSDQKFCSPKCEFEYPYQPTVTKGGCFIATAVYGNYDHPVVLDLRNFRDNWLNKRKWGQEFIDTYYRIGPSYAKFIDKSISLKTFAFIFIVKPLHLLIKLLKLHEKKS